MKTPNPDIDPFIEALRGDLPSAADEARVRARLLAAGALVTSAAVTTSGSAATWGAAATSGTATSGTVTSGTALGGAALGGAQVAGTAGAPLVLVKAGLVSKLLVLPVAAKVGIATSLALAVAATSAPLVVSRQEPAAVVAPASGVLPAAVPMSHAAPALAPAVPASEPPQVAPVSEPPQVAPVSVPPQTEPAPSAPARAEPVRRAVSVARRGPPAERASARPVLASSLAEETRLMEQAMLAVGAGEHEAARRWLDEHARRFPEGLLARERERAVARLREAGDHARTLAP